MIPFQGFLPDEDPAVNGVLKDVNNVIPTVKGFRGAPSSETAGFSALSEAANSLVVVTKLDGTRRTFAGTSVGLYETGSTTWTDRTRSVGGAYNCGATARWSFAQFGNATLAANIGDVIQESTSDVFSDISGSPQASYIAYSDGFVMACNMGSGANPNHQADGWHCCAYNDYTDWNESVSTQCTSGRLIGGGQITGVKKLGSGFAIFKRGSIYVASYVGAPVVWQFDEVVGDVGCITHNAIVDVSDRLVFMGEDDFYVFDGANPVSIGKGIREWFFEDARASELFRTIATYNPATANVTWHYVSNDGAGTTPDRAVIYNMRSGKWGKFNVTIEAAANYLGETIGWDTVDNFYTDYEDMGTVSWRSMFYQGGIYAPAVIETDHILYTRTAIAGDSSITMNNLGDLEQFTTIKQVRPRFLSQPTSSTLTYSYDDGWGDAFAVKSTATLTDTKYDLLHSSRWHQCKLNFVGDYEITGAKVKLDPDGLR